MSEEQNTTAPQVEEVAAADVQPEAAVEAPVSTDQVVESTSEKTVVEEAKNDEAPAAAADAVTTDAAAAEAAATEATPAEDVAQEKPAESEKAEPEAEKTVESSDDKALEENKTEVAEPAQDEAVVGTNGDAPVVAGDGQEQPAEETNGVCKRKAENGSEVVEDEKSPKKAKVVDEADNQTPVEETAA